MIDIMDSATLLASIQHHHPATSFLVDRYFPTNASTDMFTTDKVVVEFMEDGQTIAPFVTPRSSGMSVRRQGYEMHEYTPGRLALKVPLTVDDLRKRGFGESLYPDYTGDMRQLRITTDDMIKMQNMMTRTKEKMASEVIFTNKVTMKEYNDNLEITREEVVSYGNDNSFIFTPSKPWTTSEDSGKQIMDDLYEMSQILVKRGLPVSDLIVGSDVAKIILMNDFFIKLSDNRRYYPVNLAPEVLPNGVTRILTLNIHGRLITVYAYTQEYTDMDGKTTTYIPKGYVALGAPNAGHTAYGAITQLEANGEFETYKGKEVPKIIVKQENDVREIRLASRPLSIPFNKNPFVVSKVLGI